MSTKKNDSGPCLITLDAIETLIKVLDPTVFIHRESSPTKTTIVIDTQSMSHSSKLRGPMFDTLKSLCIAMSGATEHSVQLRIE